MSTEQLTIDPDLKPKVRRSNRPHPAHTANRLAKARRFAAALDELEGGPLTASDLMRFRGWNELAGMIGEEPPSNIVVGMVIGFAAGREAAELFVHPVEEPAE